MKTTKKQKLPQLRIETYTNGMWGETEYYNQDDLYEYAKTIENTLYYECDIDKQGGDFAVGRQTLREWFYSMLSWTDSDETYDIQKEATDILIYQGKDAFFDYLEEVWDIGFVRYDNKYVIGYITD
jgi:hypothetical protein